MTTYRQQDPLLCPSRIGRRSFLTAAGASALTLKMGLLDFASSLLGGQGGRARKARIRAVIVRPDADRYWMSWPGAAYDPEACQAEYIKTLVDAAGELDVQLELNPVPVEEPESVTSLLEQLEQSPPDGLIVIVMHLKTWPQVNYICEKRGAIPTIVFSPLGTSLTSQLEATRSLPKTFAAATHDHRWLASGMRMLKTDWQMGSSRICIVSDVVKGDRSFGTLGTTLHYIPLERWAEELRKADTTEEMREIVKYYAIEAQRIIEPEEEDILNAARNYVVARRIMAAEQCQGISLDCSRMVSERSIPCGPCLAWSKLLDEGLVGACEADADAAVSMMLSLELLGRPGFMQDPSPDTVNNTLIASHCTCATKLEGHDKPPAPFSLRSHFESNTGVALQVLWEPGREVTVMKLQRPDTMLLGTGRVVDNVAAPASGGCRTAVEIRLDNVADSRDVKGHHQLLLCGKLDWLLRAYCQLAGIKVVPI